jgi:hypothetical protein
VPWSLGGKKNPGTDSKILTDTAFMNRFFFLTMKVARFAFTQARSQPVVGPDNWFNHEVKKDTGTPFHYPWIDTEFSGYSRYGESFIAGEVKN